MNTAGPDKLSICVCLRSFTWFRLSFTCRLTLNKNMLVFRADWVDSFFFIIEQSSWLMYYFFISRTLILKNI